MIKVGYFSNQFASSEGHGIARYAHQLFQLLSRHQDFLEIYPIAASANVSAEELDYMKQTYSLSLLPWGRIITPLLWTGLNYPPMEHGLSNDIDIVHSLSLGYKICTSKPYVVTIHDIGPITHPWFFTKKDKWFMKASFRQAVFKADAIICVSNSTAMAVEACALETYNISVAERLQVIHEGVDEIFFRKIHKSEIPDFNVVADFIEMPFILSVGKISPRKNVQSVLDAFAQLKSEHPTLQLVIVGGNGWDFKKIQDYVKSLKIENRVHILGYVSNQLLRFLYQKALVFVYPSLFEGFGLTILEAMASGCPVITSNTSSLPEVAGDGAILIDPNNINELVSKISLLYSDNKMRQEIIDKGLVRAKSFSWEKTARSTHQVYKSVLGVK